MSEPSPTPRAEPQDDWVRGWFHPHRQVFTAGDVHGDWSLFVSILTDVCRVAETVSSLGSERPSLRWTGGNALVVFVGDLVDRHRPERAHGAAAGEFAGEEQVLLEAKVALNAQARQAGGGVVSAYGNHELMNVSYNWLPILARYSSTTALSVHSPYTVLSQHAERAIAQAKPKTESHRHRLRQVVQRQMQWMCGGAHHELFLSYYGIIRCGSLMFMHAGLTKDCLQDMVSGLANKGAGAGDQEAGTDAGAEAEDAYLYNDGFDMIDKINRLTRRFVQSETWLDQQGREASRCPSLTDTETELVELFDGDRGIYYTRLFSNPSEYNAHTCLELQQTFDFPLLSNPPVTKLVLGHTCQNWNESAMSDATRKQALKHMWGYRQVVAEDETRTVLGGTAIELGQQPIPPIAMVTVNEVTKEGSAKVRRRHRVSDSNDPDDPSNDIAYFGINWDCNGALFRLDLCMSRAFDSPQHVAGLFHVHDAATAMKMTEEYVRLRQPSAVCFQLDPSGTGEWTWTVLIAKRALSRPWLDAMLQAALVRLNS